MQNKLKIQNQAQTQKNVIKYIKCITLPTYNTTPSWFTFVWTTYAVKVVIRIFKIFV